MLQVIDIVQIDVGQPIHSRIDIARYGDVDEEHRAIFPPFQRTLHVGLVEDDVGGSRGADDDIRSVQVGGQLSERHTLSLQPGSQVHGVCQGTIGD
jgi:hypothetical protein